MGTIRKLDWSKLSNAVALTRVRLAAAQGKYESAKAALRLAKRRQKDAKLIVRRAKKARRQAKVELLAIRGLYAKAEAKIAKYKTDKEKAEKKARVKQKTAKADRGAAIRQRTTRPEGGSRALRTISRNTANGAKHNRRANSAGAAEIKGRKRAANPGVDGSSWSANSVKRK